MLATGLFVKEDNYRCHSVVLAIYSQRKNISLKFTCVSLNAGIEIHNRHILQINKARSTWIQYLYLSLKCNIVTKDLTGVEVGPQVYVRKTLILKQVPVRHEKVPSIITIRL